MYGTIIIQQQQFSFGISHRIAIGRVFGEFNFLINVIKHFHIIHVERVDLGAGIGAK